MPFLGSPLLSRGGPLGLGGPPPDAELTALLAKPVEENWAALDRIRAAKGNRILQRDAELLRRGRGQRRQLGIREREILRHPRREIHRRSGVQAAAHSRPAGKGEQAAIRHSEPADVFDRRAFGGESESRKRPHLVFADHSANRRGDLRSESRLHAGRQGTRSCPFRTFSLPTCYWERGFIYLFGFPITHDVETNKRNRASFKRLVQIAAEHGWGEYRTAPAHQGSVMDTYSFNNHALAPLPRNGQGRSRSQRNPFGRPLRHLAEASCERAQSHEDPAGSQRR